MCISACELVTIMKDSDFKDYMRILFYPESQPPGSQPPELLENILNPSGNNIDAMQRVYKLKAVFKNVFEQPILRNLALDIDAQGDIEVLSVVISAVDGSDTLVSKVMYTN